MEETTPLLEDMLNEEALSNRDQHFQFCVLTGIKPSDLASSAKFPLANPNLLYARAKKKRESQNCTYMFTAALSDTLLLSQVVLGAALTGLGASSSSHVLITIFGALNTIIAGLVAYLKSRGQPMRARMFRDDLERVVDEIENSEVMWLGISKSIHGYDEIDIQNQVSVRSEVARLTRLYDRAVKNNTANSPDYYSIAQVNDNWKGLKDKSTGGQESQSAAAGPSTSTVTSANTPESGLAPAVAVQDESPASDPPIKPSESTGSPVPESAITPKEMAGSTASAASAATPAPSPAPAPPVVDPDESPATAPILVRHKTEVANKENDKPKTDASGDAKA